MPSTRLSGNEIYCLAQKGYQATEAAVGNSVYSLGLIESLSAGLKISAGKELKQASQLAETGWHNAYRSMMHSVEADKGTSLIGLQCKLLYHAGYLEFLTTGSFIQPLDKNLKPTFSAGVSGQALYSLLDAGYQPLGFSFGTVVYATGLSQSLRDSFKVLSQGCVVELSTIFNHTRQQALERLIQQAKREKANAVLGIKTRVLPFSKAHKMLVTGNACYHPSLPISPALAIVTSDLSSMETWNLAKLGYVPLRLLFSTSIYSLGMVGSVKATLKSFFSGEITDLTQLMHEARQQTLAKLNQDAKALGADAILGVKMQVSDLGNGLIDIFALGTAVKKIPEVKTESEALPLQAFEPEEASFYHGAGGLANNSPLTPLFRLTLIVLIIVFFIVLQLKGAHF